MRDKLLVILTLHGGERCKALNIKTYTAKNMTNRPEKEKIKGHEDLAYQIHRIFDISEGRGYRKFVVILIVIDLIWFAMVAMDSLLGVSTSAYYDFFWILLFAIGLIVISDINKILNIRHEGWHSENFANLITFVIGLLAIVTAFVSLPGSHKSNAVFTAIKGIISLIAVFYVIIETWLIKRD